MFENHGDEQLVAERKQDRITVPRRQLWARTFPVALNRSPRNWVLCNLRPNRTIQQYQHGTNHYSRKWLNKPEPGRRRSLCFVVLRISRATIPLADCASDRSCRARTPFLGDRVRPHWSLNPKFKSDHVFFEMHSFQTKTLTDICSDGHQTREERKTAFQHAAFLFSFQKTRLRAGIER